MKEFEMINKDTGMVINVGPGAAREIYDFITEHLEVVNTTPNVEALMFALETVFGL